MTPREDERWHRVVAAFEEIVDLEPDVPRGWTPSGVGSRAATARKGRCSPQTRERIRGGSTSTVFRASSTDATHEDRDPDPLGLAGRTISPDLASVRRAAAVARAAALWRERR